MNNVNTEFELFYQNFLRDNSNLNENLLSRIKTKVRSTCEKYCNIKTPYKYRKIVDDLSKNQAIVILKQDKGRGVVIMNRSTYMDKCLAILETNKFKELNKDPTSTLEGKIQRVVRKLKNKLPENIYKKVYPTGSIPGKFNGTAKVHEILPTDGVQKLPIRPIVSNISTAT